MPFDAVAFQAAGIRKVDTLRFPHGRCLEEGKRPPHPHSFSLTKKTARFTKGGSGPYEGTPAALLQDPPLSM